LATQGTQHQQREDRGARLSRPHAHRGDKLTPVGADGKELGKFQSKIKLDATLDPKIVDLTFDTNTLEGIYKFDGKQWIICVARENVKNRPTEFKAGQDLIYIVFEKEAD
jgi:uncharacterized protein (TIGR03067 family)